MKQKFKRVRYSSEPFYVVEFVDKSFAVNEANKLESTLAPLGEENQYIRVCQFYERGKPMCIAEPVYQNESPRKWRTYRIGFIDLGSDLENPDMFISWYFLGKRLKDKSRRDIQKIRNLLHKTEIQQGKEGIVFVTNY